MPTHHTKELKERTLGLLLSLCVMALFIVWIVQTPPFIRYGVTLFIIVLIIFLPLSRIHKAARLKKIRAGQLEQHIQQKEHK